MRKFALTASALMLAFGVAACDEGPQQAQEPTTPTDQPAGTPAPQQGMTPQQEETPPPAGQADQPAEQQPGGAGSPPPAGGGSQ